MLRVSLLVQHLKEGKEEGGQDTTSLLMVVVDTVLGGS